MRSVEVNVSGEILFPDKRCSTSPVYPLPRQVDENLPAYFVPRSTDPHYLYESAVSLSSFHFRFHVDANWLAQGACVSGHVRVHHDNNIQLFLQCKCQIPSFSRLTQSEYAIFVAVAFSIAPKCARWWFEETR